MTERADDDARLDTFVRQAVPPVAVSERRLDRITDQALARLDLPPRQHGAADRRQGRWLLPVQFALPVAAAMLGFVVGDLLSLPVAVPATPHLVTLLSAPSGLFEGL